jgi:hypothetical protein
LAVQRRHAVTLDAEHRQTAVAAQPRVNRRASTHPLERVNKGIQRRARVVESAGSPLCGSLAASRVWYPMLARSERFGPENDESPAIARLS